MLNLHFLTCKTVTTTRNGIYLTLFLGTIAHADNFNAATGGGTGVSTSGATTKVGIGLAGTTASNFPLAPQKLTIGVAGGSTENVFGQFAAPSTFPGINKLRVGAGDGTGITDWSGMEVLMNWTGSTSNTSQLGFFTGSGSSSSERLTILSNGNVGIGNTIPGSLLTVNGTVGISGAVSLASSLEFTTVASGGVGRIWKSTGSGLVLQGVTGSSYDFSIQNPLAQPLLRNPAGTQSMEFYGAVTIPSTLDVTGGTFTVGTSTQNRSIALNGAATQNRSLFWKTAGSIRWAAVTNPDPESGANAGSAWQLQAFTDAGDLIDAPISIARAQGAAISLRRPIIASSNLLVSGLTTATGGLNISGGTGADGTLWKSAGAGLAVRGVTGSSYDFALFNPASQYLLRNATGTQNLEMPGSLIVSGQSSLSGVTFNGGSSGQGAIFTTGTVGLALQSKTGSLYDFSILTPAGVGNYVMRVPTGTQNLEMPGSLIVLGQSSLSGVTVNGGSSGQGAIYTTGTVGLALQSKTGSLYDFSILTPAGIGNYLMRVPTGTNTVEFPNNATVGGTLGVTGPLTVNGAANFKGELKVASIKTTTWSIAPDYVFDKGYKLASLENVEEYLNLNKHLPDIPSAKEIKQEGLDLAEMNLKLLKKVEELTLYSIEQNKKIEALNSRLSLLEKGGK